MIYAHIEDGILKGWYDSDINDVIPQGSIEVSPEVWMDALNNNHNFYENGMFVTKDLRTPEQILQEEIQSCYTYLRQTDWVEPYIIRHEMGLDILVPESNKLAIKSERDKRYARLKELGE